MLSLVHLIYMVGDKCMRQNACFIYFSLLHMLLSTPVSMPVHTLTSFVWYQIGIVYNVFCVSLNELEIFERNFLEHL